MFNATIQILRENIHQYCLTKNNQDLSYLEVVQLWQNDQEFQQFFINLLCQSPFTAYRWETPPVNNKNCENPFEFILYSSPSLVRLPQKQAFVEYFSQANSNGIVTFENLGKDATLIVPTHHDNEPNYVHLASFLRHAPLSQTQALWSQIGYIMAQKIQQDYPSWLNTAGAGVAWLHIRIDRQPKYYHYQPYKHLLLT